MLAKIAGLTPEDADTELLQISPDERRRAARTATLFTEEELTRFMQVMLRTFDDLGFRQEQRFHLELGMLKLVHLQRLLPMEQFLSQLPRSTSPQFPRIIPPSRPVTPSAAPSPRAQTPAASLPPTQVRPAVSEARKVPSAEPSSAPPLAVADTQPSEPSNVSPLAAPGAPTPPNPSTGLNTHLPASQTASSISSPFHGAPEPAILPDIDPESTNPDSSIEATPPTPQVAQAADLQAAAVEALFAAKTHNSAAEQLEETTWTLADGELRIQTSLSKQMMATIFRPDVEAILKGALRSKGFTGAKVSFLAGTPEQKSKTPRAPRTGSAQAKALEHPTVQAAQRLFNAEVTNVFDLRRD